VQHLVAVERVRTRIATDLHDDLGAGLSRIAILSEVAARGGGARGVDEVVGDIGKSARELVDVASDIVWSTDPARDDLGQLVVRLRRYAADVLEGQGIAWTLRAPPEPGALKLDPYQRRHLYLIMKEAIHNAARHAGATRVDVEVRRGGGALEAVIVDDGRGLDASTPAAGHGLRNMRARAALVGGTLTIDAPAGGGTLVALRVPLAR
jgi:signal transduction histidine kinase